MAASRKKTKAQKQQKERACDLWPSPCGQNEGQCCATDPEHLCQQEPLWQRCAALAAAPLQAQV